MGIEGIPRWIVSRLHRARNRPLDLKRGQPPPNIAPVSSNQDEESSRSSSLQKPPGTWEEPPHSTPVDHLQTQNMMFKALVDAKQFNVFPPPRGGTRYPIWQKPRARSVSLQAQVVTQTGLV